MDADARTPDRGNGSLIRVVVFILLLSLPATTLAKETTTTAEPPPQVFCTETGQKVCFDNPEGAIELSIAYGAYEFESIVDGDSFKTTDGTTIHLWGVRAPDKDHPASWAGRTLFENMLKNSDEIACKLVDFISEEEAAMHCILDGLDLGSMLVQIGVAEADGQLYHHEQEIAQQKAIGMWKH